MFKLHDRVFSYSLQEWGEIIEVNNKSDFPIKVFFDSNAEYSYSKNGSFFNNHVTPDLFFDEVTIIAPPKPMEIDTKVIVWNNAKCKYKRYFSHFSKNNKINCFSEGATSFSSDAGSYATWDNWEILKND